MHTWDQHDFVTTPEILSCEIFSSLSDEIIYFLYCKNKHGGRAKKSRKDSYSGFQIRSSLIYRLNGIVWPNISDVFLS